MEFAAYALVLEESPVRFAFTALLTVVAMAVFTWCCVDDARKRSIATWKLVLAPIILDAGAVLMSVLPEPIGCGCPWLWPWVAGSFAVWVGAVALNMRLNKQKLVGQADVTILSWILITLVGYVGWIVTVADPMFAALYIIDSIYFVITGIVLGGVLLIAGYLIWILVWKIRNNCTWKESMSRWSRAPMLIMFWPAMWIMSYLLLTT